MQPQLPAPELTENELLKRRVEELEQELADARADYEEEKFQKIGLLKDKPEVRNLYRMLCLLFSESPKSAAPADGSMPLDANRYSPWKEKFRGQTSEAIDILIKYEAGLTRKQLASYLRVEPGSGTMSQVIFKLNKAQLIHKEGNLIRLRRI